VRNGLPSRAFTPSTRAEVGEHDEAIDFSSVVAAVGDAGARPVLLIGWIGSVTGRRA
jgi:hypothetical protein